MQVRKAPNAAGSKITVTSTATNIFDLINTAASTTTPYAGYPSDVDGCDITIESETVRVLFDGNTPTSSNGFLLQEGATYSFRNRQMDKMILIRGGSTNAVCSVVMGRSFEGEGENVAGAGGDGGGGGGGSSSSSSGSTSPDVGSSTYFAKPSGTNADAVSAYNDGDSIDVTGLPYTFTQYDIERIEQIPASGTPTVYTDKSTFTVLGNNITIADAVLAADDEFVVTLSGPPRVENTPTNSNRVTLINPDSSNFTPSEDTAASQGDGTTYYNYDMADFKNGISWEILNTPGTAGTNTYTIEATNEDNGTDLSSADWDDVTQYGVDNLTGAAAASYATSVFLKSSLGFIPKAFRVKVVRSADGGNTDGAWTIHSKTY